MNRFTPRQGTKAPDWRHVIYQQDAVQGAFEAAFADYIALSQDFFIDGAVITETPSGSDIIYQITDGFACVAKEMMPVVAGTVTKSLTQVVFLAVEDAADDVTPVPNLDGQLDYVMRKRTLKLMVASAYPTNYMVLTAPRKADLEALRYKGRLVMKGGVIPFYGDMNLFTVTGLGVVGTAMEGWALCNGLNGTPDMRGMVPMGATNVPASGAPALFDGVTQATNIGDKVGIDMKTIEVDNLPAHTHGYTDTELAPGVGDVQGGTGFVRQDHHEPSGDANATTHTGLDVRQPSFALVYIMSIL